MTLTDTRSRVRRRWRPSPAQFILLAGLLTFALVVFFRSGGFGARLTPLESMILANAPEESVYAVATGHSGTTYVATSVGLIAGTGKNRWHRVPGITAPVRAVAPIGSEELYLAGETLGVSRYAGGRLEQLLPGHVEALAVDPTDPARLLAYLTGSGLYETRDHGQNWTQRSTLGNLTPLTIAISPHNPNKVAIGTLEGQIAISGDGGMTWHFPVALRGTVSALAFDAKDVGKLWAAASGQLQVSTNEGASWRMASGRIGERILVAVAPERSGGPGVVAVTVEGYLYRHTD